VRVLVVVVDRQDVDLVLAGKKSRQSVPVSTDSR
jgi:hypothetical protein